MPDVNVLLAFLAGVASFLSPCSLPLYPSYLSYITGLSVQQLKHEQNKREVRMRTLSHTLAFILAFPSYSTHSDWAPASLANFFTSIRT